MSHPDLADEALSKWEAIADCWDTHVGRDGNKYWRVLQEPCLRRMLSEQLACKPNLRALDVATGNGLCARWLKAEGVGEVIAVDGSALMLETAKVHEGWDGIDWRVLDVTNEAHWDALLEREKNEVNCLFSSCWRLVRRRGSLVANLRV